MSFERCVHRCWGVHAVTLVLLAATASSLAGCAGHVPIVASRRGTVVRDVRVVPSPELLQERWHHLEANGLVREMTSALRESFTPGAGPELVVNVVEFIAPQMSGQAWIVVRVDAMGPRGLVAQPLVLRSHAVGQHDFWTGMLGARDDAVRRVCADIVQQIANAFPGASLGAPPPGPAPATYAPQAAVSQPPAPRPAPTPSAVAPSAGPPPSAPYPPPSAFSPTPSPSGVVVTVGPSASPVYGPQAPLSPAHAAASAATAWPSSPSRPDGAYNPRFAYGMDDGLITAGVVLWGLGYAAAIVESALLFISQGTDNGIGYDDTCNNQLGGIALIPVVGPLVSGIHTGVCTVPRYSRTDGGFALTGVSGSGHNTMAWAFGLPSAVAQILGFSLLLGGLTTSRVGVIFESNLHGRDGVRLAVLSEGGGLALRLEHR